MSMNENSIKALKDYLNSGYVSNWLASSVISNYGYYIIDADELDDLDLDSNVTSVICCEGEIEEKITPYNDFHNCGTFKFCVDHLMDLFADYDNIMELIEKEDIRVWHSIKNA